MLMGSEYKMALETWSTVFALSLQDVWLGVASFLPQLLVAIVVFVVGWLVGGVLAKLVDQIFKILKIDSVLRQAGLSEATSRAGINLNSGAFVGALVKWFVIVVFLIASFEVLGLSQVNDFLKNVVLGYLPNVIVAVLILLVAAMIGDTVRKLVVGSAKAAGVMHAHFLGTVSMWAIWIFAALVALTHLGIGVDLIRTLFTGVIFAISLALALAFGLGGKDEAARMIEKTRHDMTDK